MSSTSTDTSSSNFRDVPLGQHRLGDLADPKRHTENVKVKGQDPKVLKKQLHDMLLIRFAEEKIADMVVAKKIVCPCHLAIGQEAVAVGVAAQLRPTDRGFGTHRSHSHYLASGASVEGLFAEILGKATGCSKGMGGSMHLYAEAEGFKGSVPIVAGTVSLAVGAALAAKLDGVMADPFTPGEASRDLSSKHSHKVKNWDVGVAYFGDGAAEEGTVHESLNLAQQFKLPMIFVCENNLFSSHLHINFRQPSDLVARYAMAHHMNVEVVDGNDVVAVSQAAKRLVDKARAGEGPGFLEAVTYRWRGHVGPREDNDVGLKRGEELQFWKKRDPVKRLFEPMREAGLMNDSDLVKMEADIKAEIEAAWTRAEAAAYPETPALLNMVYAEQNFKSAHKSFHPLAGGFKTFFPRIHVRQTAEPSESGGGDR